jgi:hypothetical protein
MATEESKQHFCWGEIMREIYVSHARDPVHAGGLTGMVWNDDRYIVMKADAMSQDHRRQRYDWHKRDIMPKCVVSLARHWFPNPRGFPYMGHMWE